MDAVKDFLAELVEKIKKLFKALYRAYKERKPVPSTPVPTEPQKPVVEPPIEVVDPVLPEPVVDPVVPTPVEPVKPTPPVEVELPKPVARPIGQRMAAGFIDMPEVQALNYVDLGPVERIMGQGQYFGISKNDALVFRFVTGPDIKQLTISSDEHTSMGCMSPRFVTVSETMGDFDYSKIDPRGGGSHKIMLGGDSIQGNLTGEWPHFKLKPNTVYYLNMRFEDAREGNRGRVAAPCDVVGGLVHFH